MKFLWSGGEIGVVIKHESSPSKINFNSRYFGIFGICLLPLLIYVAVFSRLLRPAADDYCLAVFANRGILGGISYWWEYLNGYVASGFSGLLLVGYPLLLLPWSLVSALPFWAAAMIMALAGIQVIRYSIVVVAIPKMLLFSVFPAALVISWWAFLWWPISWGEFGLATSFALGFTHFQSLNGTYVVQTALFVTFTLLLWFHAKDRPVPYAILFVLPGVIAGFAGITLAITVAISGLLILSYWKLTGIMKQGHRRLAVFVLSASSLVSGLLSHTSPGARTRAVTAQVDLEFSHERVATVIRGTFPKFIQDLFDAYIHPGSIAVVLILGLAVFLLKGTGTRLSRQRVLGLTAVLFTTSLVASLVSRIGENFFPNEFWHFANLRIFAFFTTVNLGILIGMTVRGPRKRSSQLFAVTGSAIIFLVTVAALLEMTNSIVNRSIEWTLGPAPILGVISDIETADGWQRSCWISLGQLRELPHRGISK